MALTELEKEILRLKFLAKYSDYRIARKLNKDIANVTRSKKNALRKLEQAKADLAFFKQLEVEVN